MSFKECSSEAIWAVSFFSGPLGTHRCFLGVCVAVGVLLATWHRVPVHARRRVAGQPARGVAVLR